MSYLFDSNILILSATPGLQLQPLLLAPGGTVSAIGHPNSLYSN